MEKNEAKADQKPKRGRRIDKKLLSNTVFIREMKYFLNLVIIAVNHRNMNHHNAVFYWQNLSKFQSSILIVVTISPRFDKTEDTVYVSGF
jgi:hypothetical protein